MCIEVYHEKNIISCLSFFFNAIPVLFNLLQGGVSVTSLPKNGGNSAEITVKIIFMIVSLPYASI